MSKFFLGAILLGQVVTTGFRQMPFPLKTFIDIPSAFEFTEYSPNMMIAGWAFDCRTGQQPPFVTVLDHDVTHETSTYLQSFFIYRDVERPDVKIAYQNECPTVTGKAGFGVFPNAELAPGTHFLTVFWNDGMGLSRSTTVAVIAR